MNKLLGSLWAKIIACVLVIASTVGIVYGAGFMILFGTMNSSNQGLDELKSEMRRNLAQNYAAMMLNNAFTNLNFSSTNCSGQRRTHVLFRSVFTLLDEIESVTQP